MKPVNLGMIDENSYSDNLPYVDVYDVKENKFEKKEGFGTGEERYDCNKLEQPISDQTPKPTSTFICDSAGIQNHIIVGSMTQDADMVTNALREAEMWLNPQEFVSTINDAINGLADEAKRWYRENFNNGYRLVMPQGGSETPPYVVANYSGAGERGNVY